MFASIFECDSNQKYGQVPISWQLFFLPHNVCLHDIYQHLWRHADFSKPKEVVTEKL